MRVVACLAACVAVSHAHHCMCTCVNRSFHKSEVWKCFVMPLRVYVLISLIRRGTSPSWVVTWDFDPWSEEKPFDCSADKNWSYFASVSGYLRTQIQRPLSAVDRKLVVALLFLPYYIYLNSVKLLHNQKYILLTLWICNSTSLGYALEIYSKIT